MTTGEQDHVFAICAYKESPYLEACVLSLLAQTIKTGVFIATSTPTKATEGIAEKYGIPLHVRNGNPGIADDWNYAVGCADAPLVTIAHQDDVYAPEYAEHALAAAERFADLLIFFTDYGEIRDGETVDDNHLLAVKRRMLAPLKNGRLARSRFVRRRILSLGSAICCPSVTLNMEKLPSPPFKDSFSCNLDWDAWERFSLKRGGFYYDPTILMHHRIHAGSETTALIENNVRTQEDLAMLCRFWPTPVARVINSIYKKGQTSNQS